MDHHLIRPDNEVDDEREDIPAAQGFGGAPQLVPPRPDVALTTLVAGVALAICVVVTVTAMAFGRGQNGQVQNGDVRIEQVQSSEAQIGHMAGPAAERSVAIAAHQLHPRS
jgi:hypothetical protein